MVYSISQHREVPITVTKDYCMYDNGCNDIILYNVYAKMDKIEHVGYLELEDTKNGVKVLYIENQQPKLFRHFAQAADQIEVEHCMNRGIANPYIQSVAAIGSHIKHYKRGKRFMDEGTNIYFNCLLRKLKKGEHIITRFMGLKKMYMPTDLVNEIKDKIKIKPLLIGLR